MKKHEFFGIPLFQKKAKNHAKIKKEILGAMEWQWLKKQNKQGLAFSDYKAGAELSGAYNHLGAIKYMEDSQGNYDASQLGLETFYSDYFGGVVESDHKELDKLYAPEIEAFMKSFGFTDKIDWQWHGYYSYNITMEDGAQDTHDHIVGPVPHTICGIHYLEFDQKEHSPAYFHNPIDNLYRACYPTEQIELVPDMFKNIIKAPKVKEGDCIWFPSWLRHTVVKQKSKKRRIAISIDVTISDPEAIDKLNKRYAK